MRGIIWSEGSRGSMLERSALSTDKLYNDEPYPSMQFDCSVNDVNDNKVCKTKRAAQQAAMIERLCLTLRCEVLGRDRQGL